MTAGERTAGLLRRLAALLYDAFLVLAIWMALGFAAQFIAGVETNRVIDGRVQTDPVFGLLLFALMCASAAAFYVWFWTRGGQTLGMLAWRIRAQSRDGSPMTVRQALLRFLCAWPSFFLFGLGYSGSTSTPGATPPTTAFHTRESSSSPAVNDSVAAGQRMW